MNCSCRAVVFLCLALPLAFLCGCGSEEGGDSAKSKSTNVVPDVKSLPPLGPYGPPLDDGRIEVAPPRNWYVPSRDNNYVVRYQLDESTTYPSILLTADDFESVLNVSPESVGAFRKALAAKFRKDEKMAAVADRMATIDIGSFAGVTYRKQSRTTLDYQKVSLDRLFVDTVVDGRHYSFELRTRKGGLEKYSNDLYAVARGLRKAKGAGPVEPIGPVEPPEAKPQPKPEEKPESKPEAKPEPKPEEKPAAEPKPEEKPKPKPEEKPKPKPTEKPAKKPKDDSGFKLLDEE